jgi:hypothetical protein
MLECYRQLIEVGITMSNGFVSSLLKSVYPVGNQILAGEM